MEQMPNDPSIFPERKTLIERAVEWGRAVLRAGRVTELCLSEHKRTEE